jgi:hypothetical protein
MSLKEQNDADYFDDPRTRRVAHAGAADGELPPYTVAEDPEAADSFQRERTRVDSPQWGRTRAGTVLARAGFALLSLALLAGTVIFITLTIRSQTRGQKAPDVKYTPPATRAAPRSPDALPGQAAPEQPAPSLVPPGQSPANNDADGDGIDDSFPRSNKGAAPALPAGVGGLPGAQRFSVPAPGRLPVPSQPGAPAVAERQPARPAVVARPRAASAPDARQAADPGRSSQD